MTYRIPLARAACAGVLAAMAAPALAQHPAFSRNLLKQPSFETASWFSAWTLNGPVLGETDLASARDGWRGLDISIRMQESDGVEQDITTALNAYSYVGSTVTVALEALVKVEGIATMPSWKPRIQIDYTTATTTAQAIVEPSQFGTNSNWRVVSGNVILPLPVTSAKFQVLAVHSSPPATWPDIKVDTCAVRVDVAPSISPDITLPPEMPIPMAFRTDDHPCTPYTGLPNTLLNLKDFIVNHNGPPWGPIYPGNSHWPRLHDLEQLPDDPLTIAHLEAQCVNLNNTSFGATVYPGHLLYYTGTEVFGLGVGGQVLASDLIVSPLFPSRLQRGPSDASWPRMDATLYSLDQQGNPDWSTAEFVVVSEVLDDGQTVLERQNPTTFPAGATVVCAPIVPWCCRLTNWWSLNFGPDCPGDPANNNRTAIDHAVAYYTSEFPPDGDIDGLEFDVGHWHRNRYFKELATGVVYYHDVDADNDRIPDFGWKNGVNVWGLGLADFFAGLKAEYGDDKILQVDAWDPSRNGARLPEGLVNGVEYEGFLKAEPVHKRISESIGHLFQWQEWSAAPRFTYAFTKEPTGTHFCGVIGHDSQFRMGAAMACMLGTPHPFSAGEGSFGVFPWDEYTNAGNDGPGWLGKPQGPPRRVLDHMWGKTDLLQPLVWEVEGYASAVFTQSPIPGGVVIDVTDIGDIGGPAPRGRVDATAFNVCYEKHPSTEVAPLVSGAEYTVTFEAKAGYHAQPTQGFVPRMLSLRSFGGPTNQSVLLTEEWRRYTLSFIATNPDTFFQFGVAEQVGRTYIRNVQMFEGGADRWMRWFQNGVVLLNGTQTRWDRNLSGLIHISGTQDPVVNNGQPVASPLRINAEDAVFLRRQ